MIPVATCVLCHVLLFASSSLRSLSGVRFLLVDSDTLAVVAYSSSIDPGKFELLAWQPATVLLCITEHQYVLHAGEEKVDLFGKKKGTLLETK